MNVKKTIVYVLSLVADFYKAGEAFTFAETTSQSLQPSSSQELMMVADAGSTGTRLYVYQLDGFGDDLQIKSCWENKVVPGLSSVEPVLMHAYITSLLRNIPVDFSANTPFILQGTGGMRQLTEEEQEYRYDLVKAQLASETNWNLSFQTISGEFEGFLEWFALQASLPKEEWQVQDGLYKVIGVGGASMQTAYPIGDVKNKAFSNVFTAELSGKTLYIASESLLGFGLEAIIERFVNVRECFSQGMPLVNGKKGEGNSVYCRNILDSIVKSILPVEIAKSFKGRRLITHGLGSIRSWLSTEDFFHLNNETTSRHHFLKEAHQGLCEESHQSLSAHYPNNSHILKGCMALAYYNALLKYFGLSAYQGLHIQKQEPSWTAAVVRLEAMKKPNQIGFFQSIAEPSTMCDMPSPFSRIIGN